MKTLKTSIVIIIAAVSAVIWGCSKLEERGSMMVKLTDAPALYQEVNVDIKSVEVHYPDMSKNDGWVTLKTRAAVYNLLELRGVTAVLADDQTLPLGKITQMRLMLGTHNSLKTGGVTYDLTVPSGTQTGIKLNVDNTIRANQKYEILLDFNAERSVIATGNGSFLMMPVIEVAYVK